jgi:hypothetical protein
MNSPSTAREVFLVETLGEVAALLDRVEAILPALEDGRLALLQASASLTDGLDTVESRMEAITESAKIQAVRYIAHRTDEMARSALDAQTRAMEEAARELFQTELEPALQRLALPLQHLASIAHRDTPAWLAWLTHAATALLASTLTWVLGTLLAQQ